MRRTTAVTFVLAAFGLLLGCSQSTEVDESMNDPASTDLWIESRGVLIPVSYVVPGDDFKQPFPLVVMAHGHGGSRQEGGGYQRLAEALARQGVATIRMDFPGCGDSTESFVQNNLSNMLLDLKAARDYVAAKQEIDDTRIGLLGYSMGGRLTTLLAADDPRYKVMALWTPAVLNGAQRELREFTMLGGPSTYSMLKQKAAKDGFAEYETRWGAKLKLGSRWFADIENTLPMDAIARFEGSLMVLYGDADDVVYPSTSEAVIAAATNSSEVVRHVVAGAEHGLGFYTNRPQIAIEVIDTTAGFFADRL